MTTVPTVASDRLSAEHRPDLAPAGGQAALEEDQRQRDDADRPRQLDVLEVAAEVDQAEPVASR